jgi:TonB family protein
VTRGVWVAAGTSVALHVAMFGAFALGRRSEAVAVTPVAAPAMFEVMRVGVLGRASPSTSLGVNGTQSRLIHAEGPGPSAPRRNLERQPAQAESPPGHVESPPRNSESPPGHPESSRGGTPPETANSQSDAVALGPSTALGTNGSGADSETADSERVLDTTALSRRLQETASRCYPPAAKRFRQSGEAKVYFCLDGAGAVSTLTLASSSGSTLLDQAVTGCVVPGAAPFGPEAFGRCFTVPVRFH